MKKLWFCMVLLCLCLTACGRDNTLIYGSEDYDRINPAMDARREIDLLIFDGLTDHDEKNQIVPRLAERWDYDADSLTYTFYLAKNVEWHDGEPFTAEDVKFTFEAIMDGSNRSCHAPDFEDVAEITVLDKYTVAIRLGQVNAAFLDYMTMPILPKHCLEGENWQESDFFHEPVGTGPYRLTDWDKGESITLKRNKDYFAGSASIRKIIFKIVPDAAERYVQLCEGELDLAQIAPSDAQSADLAHLELYTMTTADYRGLLYNFQNPYWRFNGDLIPALNYAIDRQAIVDTILLGAGEPAYSPLQRNPFNNDKVERYAYDPHKAQTLLGELGCELDGQGYWNRNGHRISFVINADAKDDLQIEIAQLVAQQLREIGLDVRAEAPAEGLDWSGQQCCIIAWGSPFDADDHTYKVFSTGKKANVSGYSNVEVDAYLTQARQTTKEAERAAAYAAFQTALSETPACTFLCYLDAVYAASPEIKGIDPDLLLGYQGMGIFRNICDWTKGE